MHELHSAWHTCLGMRGRMAYLGKAVGAWVGLVAKAWKLQSTDPPSPTPAPQPDINPEGPNKAAMEDGSWFQSDEKWMLAMTNQVSKRACMHVLAWSLECPRPCHEPAC